MDRFRTGQMSPAAPSVAGILALAAAMLVQDGMQQAVNGPAGSRLHFGLALFLVPFGAAALVAFGSVGFALRAERRTLALGLSLLAMGLVILLLLVVAGIYTVASACPAGRVCDGSPYPGLLSRTIVGILLLIVDLVASVLIGLNTLDGVRDAPVIPPRPHGPIVSTARDP